MPESLTLVAEAPPVIQATAAAEKKAPRFSILAYSGGIIGPITGLGYVVFDFAGLGLPRELAVLGDHDAALDAVAGRGEPKIVGGRELHVTGTLSLSTSAGRQVAALAAEGQPLQASVGVEPLVTRFIRPGDSVAVNGRVLTAGPGGFTLVEKGRLREVSILPFGADTSTGVQVAAKRGREKETHPMSEPTTVVPTEAEIIRAEAAAETERIAAIRTSCDGKHAEIEARAIREGWTADKVSLEVLRAERPKGPTMNAGARGASDSDVILAGALRLMGRLDLAEAVSPAAAEAAGRFRHSLDWAAACIRADGREPPRSTHGMIMAAFSTVSMPTALTESGNRIAKQSLEAAPPTIQAIGNPVDLRDFKETKVLTPVLRRGFERIGPGGELKHGTLEEELQTSIRADTYGEMFTVTYQDVVNDNLGVIPQLVVALTRNGARKLNDVGWSLILDNPSDWFGVGHTNLIAGTSTVLSAEGLRQGIEAFRKQVDADGRPLDLAPTFLAVPPELEEVASALLASAELARYVADGTDRQPTGNPYAGKLSLVIEPRLSNATFTGHSAKAWYLFAAPALGAVNIGYVQGARSPVVEQVSLPANVLGIGFRGYWDFAVALGEFRAALKATGEAE